MIAKHIPISLNKSSFSRLVNYLTDAQEKMERIGVVRTTNCYSDRIDAAIAEVLNTQQINKRAVSDKTYHLVISFHHDDEPSVQTIAAIEEELCAGLGFGEHQRISVVHHDTDNLHIHVAINKIHSLHHTIHNPNADYKKLGHLCEAIEHEYNLVSVDHKTKKRGADNSASEIEQKAGIESFIGWVRRECLEQIKNAGSWEDLRHILKNHSLEIRERGNGFVFVSNNGIAVKASSVDRSLSKRNLTQRLGKFINNDGAKKISQTNPRQYEPKPVQKKLDATKLYARYVKEQSEAAKQRTDQWEKLRNRRDHLIESTKKEARLKRSIIKNIQAARLAKKLMVGVAYQQLKAKIEKIKNEYRDAYQVAKINHQKMAWLDWLAKEAKCGNSEALETLRSRRKRENKGNVIYGNGSKGAFVKNNAVETITKNGTAIYKVGTTTIRDDGKRLIVLPDTPQDELKPILQLAIQKYGNKLAVNGMDTFREQIVQVAVSAKLNITFDDKNLEQYRQRLLNPNFVAKQNGEKIKEASKHTQKDLHSSHKGMSR